MPTTSTTPRTPGEVPRLRAFAEAQAEAGIPYYQGALDDPRNFAALEHACAKDERERAASTRGRPIRPDDLVDVDEANLVEYTSPRRSRREAVEIRDLENAATVKRRRAGRRQHRRAAARGMRATTLEHKPWIIAGAIPHGAKAVSSRSDALEALLHSPDFRGRRADAQRTLHALYELLALSSGPMHTTSPGELAAVQRLKIHRSTYYAHLAWLIRHRFLGVVCSGLSRNFAGRGNEARRAVYVLSSPYDPPASAGANTARMLARAWNSATAYRTGRSTVDFALDALSPTPSDQLDSSNPRTHDLSRHQAENEPLRGTEYNPGAPPGRAHSPQRSSARELSTARQRGRRPEGCSARAAALQARAPFLRAIARASLARLIGPFVAAGDTNDEILFRLDHSPSGSQPHSGMTGVKYPAAIVKYRLGFWLTRDRKVIPTPSQVSRRDRERAEIRKRRQRLFDSYDTMQARVASRQVDGATPLEDWKELAFTIARNARSRSSQ